MNSFRSSRNLRSTVPDRGLEVVAAAPAPVSQKLIVPEGVRALLGPSWTIEGEDPERYEELLAQVAAAVQPKDIIDWLLLSDVVALTWQIHRSRKLSENFVRIGRRAGMQKILELSLSFEYAIIDTVKESKCSILARAWFNGDKEAEKTVNSILSKAGLTMDDVTAQSIRSMAVDLNRLDQQNERHEARRDAILQQLERRRAGWAERVQRASEEAVDAEFREIAPVGSGGLTNADGPQGAG
jgi:hypothetical protein